MWLIVECGGKQDILIDGGDSYGLRLTESHDQRLCTT